MAFIEIDTISFLWKLSVLYRFVTSKRISLIRTNRNIFNNKKLKNIYLINFSLFRKILINLDAKNEQKFNSICINNVFPPHLSWHKDKTSVFFSTLRTTCSKIVNVSTKRNHSTSCNTEESSPPFQQYIW